MFPSHSRQIADDAIFPGSDCKGTILAWDVHAVPDDAKEIKFLAFKRFETTFKRWFSLHAVKNLQEITLWSPKILHRMRFYKHNAVNTLFALAGYLYKSSAPNFRLMNQNEFKAS